MSGIPLFIPIMIGAIVIGLGLIGSRGQQYWARALAAIGVAFAMAFLGAGGGTLDDPSGDGLITRSIREASDDGPVVAIWGIAVLVAGYGAIIYLIVTGIRRDRAAKATRPNA